MWMRQWMLFVDLSLLERLDALEDIISITIAMVHHIGQTRADSLGPFTMLVELSFLPAARCRYYIDNVVDMAQFDGGNVPDYFYALLIDYRS